jgi:hypothetical protein
MECAECGRDRGWLAANLRTLCFGKPHCMFVPAGCLCRPRIRRMYYGLLGWYLWALRNVLVADHRISAEEATALRVHFEAHLAAFPLMELAPPAVAQKFN